MIVLICDDQKSVHTFLEKSIDWPSMRVSRILHAYNGQECLDCLVSERPDLLLLDIRMPAATGIDVLQEMKKLQLHTVTIILSAYSDFHYAKEAFKCGAYDYELKPIDSSHLNPILSSALKLQLGNYLSLLHKLLDGRTPSSVPVPNDLLDRLGIGAYLGILAVFQGDSSFEQSLFLQELLQDSYDFLIPLNDIEYFMLYPLERQSYSQAVRQIQAQHLQFCSTMPDSRLCFSVSRSGTGLSFLKESLSQCRQAMHDEFYLSSNFLVYNDHLPSDNFHKFLLQYRLQLYTCLANGTGKEHAFKILDKLFALFRENRIQIEDLTDICFNILYFNISFILNQSAESELLLRHDIKSCRSLTELHAFMKDTLSRQFFDSAVNTPIKTPIQQIHEYLSSNFSEKISLDDLAKKFYVSKYALCRGFRQEYAEGLWDFLKRIRMEHAQLLLATTDLKIYEVAEQCGFSDSNYFSSTYKKFYGHTPQQEKKES